MAKRLKVNIQDSKKLVSLEKYFFKETILVHESNIKELFIITEQLDLSLVSALEKSGCFVEEIKEISESEIIEFGEKLDVRIAVAINQLKPNLYDNKIFSVIAHTSIANGTTELDKYEYKLYPGLGSSFVMNLSANEIIEILKQDWLKKLVMPRVINL